MGSFINVGIAYSEKNVFKINDDLISLIEYLSRFCDRILVKYPKDDSYEIWEEELFEREKGLVDAFKILNTKKMSSGKMIIIS